MTVADTRMRMEREREFIAQQPPRRKRTLSCGNPKPQIPKPKSQYGVEMRELERGIWDLELGIWDLCGSSQLTSGSRVRSRIRPATGSSRPSSSRPWRTEI